MLAPLSPEILVNRAIGAPSPRPLAFRTSKGRYRAHLRQSARGHLSPKQASDWWGSFESGRNVFVDAISLSADGRSVDLPLSAYGDLANVNEIRVQLAKDGCILVIVGGDAGSGYKATIRVRGVNVVERTVRDGEFPENFYEITRYVRRAPKE
jgi:hypothetical protein